MDSHSRGVARRYRQRSCLRVGGLQGTSPAKRRALSACHYLICRAPFLPHCTTRLCSCFQPFRQVCFPLPEQLLLSRSLRLPKEGGYSCWAMFKHLQKRARVTEFISHVFVHQLSNAPVHKQALRLGALAHSSRRNKTVQLI